MAASSGTAGTGFRIVIFPGEGKNRFGTTIGHLYVLGGFRTRAYEVAAGPPPGKGFKDRGGHSAEITPPGLYILDRAEHHTSEGWPQSVVPWGAEIRDSDGVIQFRAGTHWVAASGRMGKVTAALIHWGTRSKQRVSLFEADIQARAMFFENGVLLTRWKKNDFGKWSWNLKRGGHRTAFYIHTTPEDERATEANTPFDLMQSHGCVHIRPRDRDELIKLKALRQGIEVRVMPYGQIGPP